MPLFFILLPSELLEILVWLEITIRFIFRIRIVYWFTDMVLVIFIRDWWIHTHRLMHFLLSLFCSTALLLLICRTCTCNFYFFAWSRLERLGPLCKNRWDRCRWGLNIISKGSNIFSIVTKAVCFFFGLKQLNIRWGDLILYFAVLRLRKRT